MDNDPILPEESRKQYRAWQRAVAADLPALAQRLFGLRGKPFSGHGMRYQLEKSFGKVVVAVSSIDRVPTLSESLINQVIYDGFLEDLAAAEASAAEKSP